MTQPYLSPRSNSVRGDELTARAKLGITLMWLANGTQFQLLQSTWGIGRSTISVTLRRTVKLLKRHLVPQVGARLPSWAVMTHLWQCGPACLLVLYARP